MYQAITPPAVGEDAANVMRQALAGMLWSKQHFLFDVDKWINEHGNAPPRNREWFHLIADDVISMPDKWEYPWFAAWDLAFHTLALSSVDPDFAKQQLDLLLDQLKRYAFSSIRSSWRPSESRSVLRMRQTLAISVSAMMMMASPAAELVEPISCSVDSGVRNFATGPFSEPSASTVSHASPAAPAALACSSSLSQKQRERSDVCGSRMARTVFPANARNDEPSNRALEIGDDKRVSKVGFIGPVLQHRVRLGESAEKARGSWYASGANSANRPVNRASIAAKTSSCVTKLISRSSW